MIFGLSSTTFSIFSIGELFCSFFFVLGYIFSISFCSFFGASFAFFFDSIGASFSTTSIFYILTSSSTTASAIGCASFLLPFWSVTLSFLFLRDFVSSLKCTSFLIFYYGGGTSEINCSSNTCWHLT